MGLNFLTLTKIINTFQNHQIWLGMTDWLKNNLVSMQPTFEEKKLLSIINDSIQQ